MSGYDEFAKFFPSLTASDFFAIHLVPEEGAEVSDRKSTHKAAGPPTFAWSGALEALLESEPEELAGVP